MTEPTKKLNPIRLAKIFGIALVFTIIIHPGLWFATAKGYAGDHLFNLSKIQIFGLVVITLILVLLLYLICTASSYFLSIWLHGRVPRWLLIFICALAAFLLCALALAWVPQLHYQYYRSIFPGLVAQWVPIGDLSLKTLWQYLILPANGSTTVHANGVSVWICICASVLVASEQSRR